MTDTTATQESENVPLPPMTTPANLQIRLCGLDEETANRFGPLLGGCIQTISRFIDLERLDGVTVATDYPAALAELERGFETTHVLTPTREFGIGVAMTPVVMRDGIVKAHIVLDARFILPIEDESDEFFPDALHILAHECAHVAVMKATETAFPGMLLHHRYEDLLDAFRGQAIEACWDEYAAARLSAIFGRDRTATYEETFVCALRETRDRANARIRAYRTHGDHGQVLSDVAGQYGNLMKFAAYLIGHLHGAGQQRDAAPEAATALQDHWFAPYFERLDAALAGLWEDLGTWQSRDRFRPIADIAEEIVAEGGVHISRLPEGEVNVRVPFTAETIPT